MTHHRTPSNGLDRPRSPRILFVGSAYDSQTARWLEQLQGTGWDLHLFDPTHSLLHPGLSGITVHTAWKKPSPAGVTVRHRWPFQRGRYFLARRLPRLWRRIVGRDHAVLARLIERLRPACIHTLGMQPYSYVAARARELGARIPFPPWIYSCKGSDIFNHQVPEHLPRIREVLEGADYLLANCHRDEELARRHGFQGELWGLFQGGGGYSTAPMQELRAPGPPSSRRTIAVKGLQHGAGRALVALDALRLVGEPLQGHQIVLYQAHPEVAARARALAGETGLSIQVLPRVPPEEIWALFGKARVSLAVGVSDGIPNAMLESMIMGAFPIQTNPGGATAEWITDGHNGLLIPADSPHEIAAAVSRALTDGELVDGAAPVNLALAQARIERSDVRAQVLRCYRAVVDRRPSA